jgi:hypothetical protein
MVRFLFCPAWGEQTDEAAWASSLSFGNITSSCYSCQTERERESSNLPITLEDHCSVVAGMEIRATVNQHPPVHHPPDDACYDSVVDDPQLSYYPVSSWV